MGINLLKRVLNIAGISTPKFLFITFLLASVSILDVTAIGLVPLILYSYNDTSKLPDFMIDNIYFSFEYLLIYLVVAFILKFIFIVITNGYVVRVGVQKHKEIMVSLLDRYHKYNYIDFSKSDPNNLINILINAVQIFIDKALYPYLKIIPDIIILASILAVILYIDIYIPLSIIIIFAIMGAVFFLTTGSFIKKWGAELLDALSSMYEVSRKSIEGFEEIKTSNTGKFFVKKLEIHADKYKEAAANHQILSMIPKQLMETGFVVIFVLGMFVSQIYGVSFNEIVPVAGAIAVASIRMLPIVINIMSSISLIRYATSSVDMLENELNNTKANITNINYIDNFNSISLEAVSFGYGKNVLIEDLNLKLGKNEVIGIVGPSGSGKSTLLRIILGLIQPDQGKIIIDGKKRKTDEVLCSSLLSQNNFILNGSVLENITLGEIESDYDIQKVYGSLKMSGLYEYISKQDLKEKMIVGDKGETLSGGQIQRLALARIFNSSKDLLVFDEPTSSLDLENSKIIFDSLHKIKKNKIVIVVTHDEKLADICDQKISLK
tara:strand:+ start:4277 stop:5926 length:1650 start_codon:yes stop_codon:yes gene_type:complete